MRLCHWTTLKVISEFSGKVFWPIGLKANATLGFQSRDFLLHVLSASYYIWIRSLLLTKLVLSNDTSIWLVFRYQIPAYSLLWIYGILSSNSVFVCFQVCVSPAMGDVSETKSALFFGSRAMKITNTAYVNVEVRFNSTALCLLWSINVKWGWLANTTSTARDICTFAVLCSATRPFSCFTRVFGDLKTYLGIVEMSQNHA